MFANTAISLPFYSYGILMLIGFAAGLGIYYLNCLRLKKSISDLVDLSLTITISGIIGARILYIALFPEQFNRLSEYFALHEGGLVFYGSLLVAIPALVIYAQFKQLALPQLLDFLAPSFALAHAIGRLGCLINSCCYGAPTTSLTIYRLVNDPPEVYRHPTQIYESMFLLLVFILLQKMLVRTYRCQSHFQGFTSGIYLISYSFFRFLIEFIRGDNRGEFLTSLQLSPSQVTALLLIAVGCCWLSYCYKHPYITGVKSNEQS